MSDEKRIGLGFAELLALIFIVLKLCKVIEWSWWWVLSPIWIQVIIGVILIIVYIIVEKRS